MIEVNYGSASVEKNAWWQAQFSAARLSLSSGSRRRGGNGPLRIHEVEWLQSEGLAAFFIFGWEQADVLPQPAGLGIQQKLIPAI